MALSELLNLSAPALFHHLRETGVSIRLGEDGQLRYGGPKSAITEEVITALKARKERLVYVLGPDLPMVCFSCGHEIPQSAPEGDGPFMTQVDGHWRFYHPNGCLPHHFHHDTDRGTVERVKA